MKESYLQDIFEGKFRFNDDELIELNKRIKQESFNENQFNEAKYFINQDKVRENLELYESHIIKPILGFLNSYEGFGNLYLGIDTGGSGKSKFLDVKPISEKIIKSEEDLRDLIFEKLGTLPISPEKPKIEIKKVEFKSGNVFVIFVERCNNYSVYYSRLTDYIYKRNSDETKKISLIESLQLIESKKNPRVSLRLQLKKDIPGERKNTRELVYSTELINEGLEPSFFTTGVILITLRNNFNVEVKESPWTLIDKSDFFYRYQFKCGMPPVEMPVYPMTNTAWGDFTIITEGSFFNLDFEIKIFDKKGITYQKFSLSEEFKVGISEVNLNPINEEIHYSPYI